MASNLSQYADKEGKVYLGTFGDNNSPYAKPAEKAPKQDETAKKQDKNTASKTSSISKDNTPTLPTTNNATKAEQARAGHRDNINRNTRRLGVKSALDSMFGSGRSAQGTIGNTPAIFQAQKQQLQEEIDRDNAALNTIATAEAELAAAQSTQEGRHKLEATDAELNRQQERLNELQAGRTSLERFIESGKTEIKIRAEQARRLAFDDAVEAARAQRVSFDLHGRHLSRQMNDQQIDNAIRELNQLGDTKLDILRRNLAETARITGIAESEGKVAQLEALINARNKAERDGNRQLAAAINKMMNAGLVSIAGSYVLSAGENILDRIFGNNNNTSSDATPTSGDPTSAPSIPSAPASNAPQDRRRIFSRGALDNSGAR